MPRLAILSGKGGAGKTTVAAHLAWALSRAGASVVLGDGDAEAPNLACVLPLSEQGPELAVTMSQPQIDPERCTACGACVEACHFNALTVIGGYARMAAELCHGCGLCKRVCPAGAIKAGQVVVGTLARATVAWPDGLHTPITSGRTTVGLPRTPAVVAGVRRDMAQLAAASADANPVWQLLDGAPGAACPAVAAAQHQDLVVVVADDSPFGAHDCRRLLAMLADLGQPCVVLINRLHQPSAIADVCAELAVPVVGRLANEPRVAEIAATGQLPGALLTEWMAAIDALAMRLMAGVEGSIPVISEEKLSQERA